jgi:hypothetical protein
MKSNKAHKRITKIEVLISDLVNRFSTGSAHVAEAIRSAAAAVTRAREAVALEDSPGSPKKSKPVGKARKRKTQKSTERRKKTVVKKSMVKPAEESGGRSLVRRAAKKRTTVPE